MLDSKIYTNPELSHLWITILLKAAHQDRSFYHGSKLIELKKGQLLTGRKSLAICTGMTESKIFRFLKTLEIEQQIEQQTNNQYSIITVLRWDEYQNNEQQVEQPVNNQRTTDEQPVNTNKNDKKEKKVKNEKKESTYPQDFEIFWKEYLSRTKRPIGSKPNALTQWKKLSENECAVSIQRLSQYQTSMSMGEFMKDAERYLKGKIWESYDSTVQLEFGVPQNVKTGSANGRNLPEKKTWEEFLKFCEKIDFTKDMDLRKVYPEIEFDQWGDFALKNAIWTIKGKNKENLK